VSKQGCVVGVASTSAAYRPAMGIGLLTATPHRVVKSQQGFEFRDRTSPVTPFIYYVEYRVNCRFHIPFCCRILIHSLAEGFEIIRNTRPCTHETLARCERALCLRQPTVTQPSFHVLPVSKSNGEPYHRQEKPKYLVPGSWTPDSYNWKNDAAPKKATPKRKPLSKKGTPLRTDTQSRIVMFQSERVRLPALGIALYWTTGDFQFLPKTIHSLPNIVGTDFDRS
jgi:hypothetical protein